MIGVHKAIQQLKEMYDTDFTTIFKTITSDNGSEFSELLKRLIPNWCNTLLWKILVYHSPNDRYEEEMDNVA